MGAGTLSNLFRVVAAGVEVFPLFLLNKLENEIDDIDDALFSLSIDADASSILRIEGLKRRRARKFEHVRAIRSALGHDD